MDTQESIPYLTHQDFLKNIKDVTDFCDYAVINLCYDKQSSGIKQYYHNDAALDKLLKQVVETRNQELGKLAAFEFEQVKNDRTDYTTSVQRAYHRNSIVSPVKPMMLFVQFKMDDVLGPIIDPKVAQEKIDKFLNSLISKCKTYKIDGVIVHDSD